MSAMATRRERYAVLRDVLEGRKREIHEKVRSLREALPAEILEGRSGEEQSFDDRMREVNIALIEMKSETLRQIDEARLDSGTYRACPECGGKLPWPRLRALPFVRLCRACQEEEESREAAQRAARLPGPLLEELDTGASERGASVWSRPRGAESRMRQSRRVRATATAGLSMCQGEA